MENLFKIIVLAVIQGVTEFLPVSSSGHLVLSKYVLGFEASDGALLEVVLHAGTLVSILVFYHRRLGNIIMGVVRGDAGSIRFALLVVLGCIPAIIFGFMARPQLEQLFSSPIIVSCALITTGLFLIVSHFPQAGSKRVNWVSGIVIGLAQAVAMIPGISRSGSTIGMARFFKIEPKEAAEFSFLMSAPLLAGVSLLYLVEAFHTGNTSTHSLFELITGFVVATVVGYFSIKWLVSLLQRGRFWRFGFYCIAAGSLSLILLLL